MMRWNRRLWRGRRLAAVGIFLGLVGFAKLHACACTGGPTSWRSVGAITVESP